MISRRLFLQNGIKSVAAANLIGTTMSSGTALRDHVPALKGEARQVVVPTHEHFGDIEERLDFPANWESQCNPWPVMMRRYWEQMKFSVASASR